MILSLVVAILALIGTVFGPDKSEKIEAFLNQACPTVVADVHAVGGVLAALDRLPEEGGRIQTFVAEGRALCEYFAPTTP